MDENTFIKSSIEEKAAISQTSGATSGALCVSSASGASGDLTCINGASGGDNCLIRED